MLQSSLCATYGNSMNNTTTANTTDEETLQDVETATRFIDKYLNNDSCFPSLMEVLQIPVQGGTSMSGLNENDYPSSGENRALRHLHTLKKVPLPADLLHHFQNMQCNCMMGLFPEIKRAWLTIDSDIYVWVFEDGNDLAYFDGLHDTILGVGLVNKKEHVFKPYIEYLLCLTTPTEIVLLGVSFSTKDGSMAPSMHLLPEPLFSMSTDGAYILTIKGTKDGRIFLGAKDGSLWELVYGAEDGWFSRKCYKVNHSRSALCFMLPSFLTLSEDDPIIQIEIDESRHILYTLSEKGNISVFDLGSTGTTTNRVDTLYQTSIMNFASQVAKTIDKANFKQMVSICPVTSSESPHIHLVVVTGSGVRLYYSTTPLNNPQARPSKMYLLHIRLPPGFAANALTHRPTKVHKALYSKGTAILCASESADYDVIWTVSNDQYPYHGMLAESQTVLPVDGYIWAMADITPPLWCSALNPPTAQGTSPPLLVTQHQQAPKQLVLLSASGAHILTALRPVDQLKHLLQESRSADAPAVKEFFMAMTVTQACATCLILAMEPNLQQTMVAELARDALFRYGSLIMPTFQPVQSPTNYPFQPVQMSTPVQNSNVVSHQMASDQQQYSPLHNSLYLYLARILRPVWATQLAKEQHLENKTQLVSSISSEEAAFLARHVELLSNFLLTNQGPGQALPFNQSMVTRTPNNATSGALNTYALDGNMSERSSLLAMRVLLKQTLEILRLWTVLTIHDFPKIAEALPNEVRDRIRTLMLRDLVQNGKEICRNLIMALMDRYHGDNASIDTISTRLRDVCPSLYRVEDAKLSKANEIILAAKNDSNKVEKEKCFREAVELCKQIGQSVNVAGICNQLASGSWYEGVVDLCLSVASQRDPIGQALHYYKHNEPSNDAQGYLAFTYRLECYKVIMDHLNQLIGNCALVTPGSPPSIPNRPGPPSQQEMPTSDAGQYAQQMIKLIVASTDELAQVTLFQWLIDTGRTDRLSSIESAFLEPFFVKGGHNDLLWRYYERNQQYYNAAKTLAHLADQVSETPLHQRLEYLSRALMCLSSSQMTTTTSYADFMLHLEEKKDVARVQLMVLKAIQAKNGPAELINSLSSSLLDITNLYENYAEKYDLWESKLAIVHCAGHSEPQLIKVLWTNIIDTELNVADGSSSEFKVDSLVAKLKSLARTYSTSTNYFPLEHIIKTCETRAIKLKVENCAWAAMALKTCGVPVSKLIAVYHRLYVSGDSIWEVERAPFHLLKVLVDLFRMLSDNSAILTQQEKRALREECLDYIAAYLTDLGASADSSAILISSHLKACQLEIEKS